MYTEMEFAVGMAPAPAPVVASIDATEQLFDIIAAPGMGATWDEVTNDAQRMLTPLTDAQMAVALHNLTFYRCLDDRGELSRVGAVIRRLGRRTRVGFDTLPFLVAARMEGAEEAACKIMAALEACKGDTNELNAEFEDDEDRGGSVLVLPSSGRSDHAALVELFDAARDLVYASPAWSAAFLRLPR
jgi:HrpA-like RNA helicase